MDKDQAESCSPLGLGSQILKFMAAFVGRISGTKFLGKEESIKCEHKVSHKLTHKFVADIWIVCTQDEIPHHPGETAVLMEERYDQRFELLMAAGETDFYVQFMPN